MAKKRVTVNKAAGPVKKKKTAAAGMKGGKRGGQGAVSTREEVKKVTPPIEKVFFPDKWNNTEKVILARRSTHYIDWFDDAGHKVVR